VGSQVVGGSRGPLVGLGLVVGLWVPTVHIIAFDPDSVLWMHRTHVEDHCGLLQTNAVSALVCTLPL
jgi:hypothetical protein